MVLKYVKNIWFWIVLLPIVYLLSGFFLLPWLTKTQLPSFVQKEYHLNIDLDDVRFNPITFELNVDNFFLYNLDKKPVVNLKHLYVDYDFLALFKKEITINRILFDEPILTIQKDKNGTFNILEALSKMPSSKEDNTTQTSAMDLPFNIEALEIKNGNLTFTDLTPSEPFVLNITPIHYSLQSLSFKKNDLSIHTLELLRKNQEKISLESSLSLDPLVIHGKLNISALNLTDLWQYVLPKMPAKLKEGTFSGTFPFTLDLSKKTAQLILEKNSLSLHNIVFHDQNNTPFMRIPELQADGLSLHWPDSTIELQELNIKNPYLAVILQKDYTPNLSALFTLPNQPVKENSAKKDESKPWAFSLKTLNMSDGNVTLVDQNVHQGTMSFSKMMLNIHDISTNQNQPIDYNFSTILNTTGQFSSAGSYNVAKGDLQATMNAKTIPLNKFQPYIAPFTALSLVQGDLSVQSNLKANFKDIPTILFNGGITLSNLLINDTFSQPLIAWQDLSLNEVVFNTNPKSLQLNHITLNKPYINLDIKKDGTTNFTNIVKESSTTSTPSASSKQESMHIYLGDAILQDAKANFQDASLIIPFKTLIQNLNGKLSTLDTKSDKPSVLNLEGKVDKYGYAKISGSLLPLDFKSKANVKFLFKNIDMPSLTPYSGKFIGYAIKEGKLSMDLSYKIQKGLMEGSNKINLDSLTLGEKIESPDATNLPLGLAIAILKDSKGQIDLNLPVSGDLNSPDFKYGAIVWKALGNLLGSILTSPFNLIGSLLGIEGETLKSIDFSTGEFAIISSEEEKMEQYKKILIEKPALKLSITPSFNEDLDTKALQEKALTTHLETLTKSKKIEPEAYRKILKELFIQRFSSEEYATLIKTAQEAKQDQGEINQILVDKLAKTFTLEAKALDILANQRADAILNMMIQKYALPKERLVKTEVESTDAKDEQWISCKIGISN